MYCIEHKLALLHSAILIFCVESQHYATFKWNDNFADENEKSANRTLDSATRARPPPIKNMHVNPNSFPLLQFLNCARPDRDSTERGSRRTQLPLNFSD